jgi:hypothetical protein
MEYNISNINQLLINDGIEYGLKTLILNTPTDETSDDLSKKDKSWIFGTPVVTTITMSGSKSVDLLTYNTDYNSTISELKLDNILLVINKTKNVESSSIIGTNGDVTSSISIESINITINGEINMSYGKNAGDEIIKLNSFLRQSRPVAVTCKEFQDIGINFIIIKSFDFKQVAGEFSTQYYNISATKYEPSRNRLIIKKQ